MLGSSVPGSEVGTVGRFLQQAGRARPRDSACSIARRMKTSSASGSNSAHEGAAGGGDINYSPALTANWHTAGSKAHSNLVSLGSRGSWCPLLMSPAVEREESPNITRDHPGAPGDGQPGWALATEDVLSIWHLGCSALASTTPSLGTLSCSHLFPCPLWSRVSGTVPPLRPLHGTEWVAGAGGLQYSRVAAPLSHSGGRRAARRCCCGRPPARWRRRCYHPKEGRRAVGKSFGTGSRGKHSWIPAPYAVHDGDIAGRLSQQQLHRLHAAVLAGAHQRGRALLVLQVHVRPAGEQGFHHLLPSVADGQHQRRLAGLRDTRDAARKVVALIPLIPLLPQCPPSTSLPRWSPNTLPVYCPHQVWGPALGVGSGGEYGSVHCPRGAQDVVAPIPHPPGWPWR